MVNMLIGLVVSFGMLLGAFVIEKGQIASLVLPSPAMIVFGGTIGAAIISFGFDGMISGFQALMASFKPGPDPEDLIKKICTMADKCRAEGLLTLQSMMTEPDFNTDNYLMLKEGIVLATDTKSAENMEATLSADLHSYTEARQQEVAVWEGAGGFSPTMGVIGTVMGLISVLSHMGSDTSALAGSIGVAFIATLYGVAFANIIYLPVATHLKICMKRQIIFREMIIDGMCMLVSGDSSRNIENKLALYYHAFPKCEDKYKAGIDN